MTRIRHAVCSRATDDSGFSLIELVVSIAIATVIGAAIMTFVAGVNRAGRFTESTAYVLDEARRAGESIQREARQADRLEGGSGPLSLVLSVDATGDGAVDTVTYTVLPAEGQLRRSVNGGVAQVLASGIDSTTTSAFVYDVAPPDTREVGITLSLEPTDAGGGALQTVQLTVRVRNVR